MTYEVWLVDAMNPYILEGVSRVEQTETTYSFFDKEALIFSAPFTSVASVRKV